MFHVLEWKFPDQKVSSFCQGKMYTPEKPVHLRGFVHPNAPDRHRVLNYPGLTGRRFEWIDTVFHRFYIDKPPLQSTPAEPFLLFCI